MAQTIWKILVQHDGGTLQIPPSNLFPLEEGTAAVWVFDFDLPGNTVGAVVLNEESGRNDTAAFGPFTHLEHQRPTLGPSLTEYDHRFRIYASGFSGDTQPVSYRACLLDAANLEEVTCSNVAELKFPTQEGLVQDPQRVTVSLELSAATGSVDFAASLRVSPERLVITPGASVVWDFDLPLNLFLEETWYPEILFQSTLFGPFQSISATANVVGTDPTRSSVQLIGSGDNGLRGSFDYICRVRSSSGKIVVASGDPGIDDDGELQTPPSGTPPACGSTDHPD